MDHCFALLKTVHIFAGLSDGCLHNILANSAIIHHPANRVIITEGTPATEIYVILKGRVKIILNLEQDPLEIVEFGPGECVGEASVIGILSHSASAVTTRDTEVLVLSRKLLMEYLDRDCRLFSLLLLNIARELARRLHHTDEILLHYSRKNKRRIPTD